MGAWLKIHALPTELHWYPVAGSFFGAMEDCSAQTLECSIRQTGGESAMQSVSATDSDTIQRWLAEVSRLPTKKRKQWKGLLWDYNRVAQRVRFNGKHETVMGVPYLFVVRKHAQRGWWPVIDADHAEGSNDIQKVALTRNGAAMLQSEDKWGTFVGIQDEQHSGNHKRSHFVKVPTAPGQPLRG